jgi:hypothetical protein
MIIEIDKGDADFIHSGRDLQGGLGRTLIKKGTICLLNQPPYEICY